ncbi:archaellum component FlaC [Halarchaeum solikamskense]|uniref:hypothetical protein n=1 Tax=Halarchaeum nitratireducens TaxID=489913 RepID=UPI001B3AAE8D|nr:hypothetical protein [Halarchaeum solikamskense]MBP2252924.1 archaellum component FlaC [Halarchaeum solikamskense]
MYNLLELDPTVSLLETIQRDEIPDEDVRKIEYYLPKISSTLETLSEEASDQFDESVQSLFPVRLSDGQTRDLHEDIEERLAASPKPRIDLFLLAQAASNEHEQVRGLFETIRSRDLDQQNYLGSSDGGYTRLAGRIYSLQSDDFRSEFNTAIEKVKNASQMRLIDLLDSLDSSVSPDDVYSTKPPFQALITSNYDPVGSSVAEWLLGSIEAGRIIRDNETQIESAYEENRDTLSTTNTSIEELYESISESQSKLPDGKIQYDDSIVGDITELIRRADRIDSPTAKFVLGFDRTGRNCLFTTLEANLTDLEQKLNSVDGMLSNGINQINGLEDRLETSLDEIDDAYEIVAESDVSVDLPDKDTLKEEVREYGQETITDLKERLPAVDVSDGTDSIRKKSDTWDEEVQQARRQITPVRQQVENLSRLAENCKELTEVRDEQREQLTTVREQLEETQ